MGCRNCNIELNHTPGKRKKQFCSPDCRVRYWQKNKPKKSKEFENELEKCLTESGYRERMGQANKDLFTFGFAIIPENPNEPLISPMSEKGVGLISTYLSQKSPDGPKNQEKVAEPPKNEPQKHPLWKQGDPKENTGGFFLKYDCNNYEELSKLKKNV